MNLSYSRCKGKIERFVHLFKKTKEYAELNKHYPEFEIFEETQGKFELEVVQAAFNKWAKQQATDRKRAEFTKNLNQLISTDYVLVRKRT